MDLDVVPANHRVNWQIEKISEQLKTEFVAIKLSRFNHIRHDQLRNESLESDFLAHLRDLTTHIFRPIVSIEVAFGSYSATIRPSRMTSRRSASAVTSSSSAETSKTADPASRSPISFR